MAVSSLLVPAVDDNFCPESIVRTAKPTVSLPTLSTPAFITICESVPDTMLAATPANVTDCKLAPVGINPVPVIVTTVPP